MNVAALEEAGNVINLMDALKASIEKQSEEKTGKEEELVTKNRRQKEGCVRRVEAQTIKTRKSRTDTGLQHLCGFRF